MFSEELMKYLIIVPKHLLKYFLGFTQRLKQFSYLVHKSYPI